MLIFLDTETTGVELEDKICSLGFIAQEGEEIISMYELFNEGKKIPPQASAIHHITNEMIKDKNSFKESELYKFLEKHNSDETTIVAHNAAFDMQKLSLSGFVFKGSVVDTLRTTKHLIPECELFSLQVLRYELRLYKQEKNAALKCGIKDALVAHNALSDALLVRELYTYLLDMATLDEMHSLSFKKVLLSKFGFGKYLGRFIEEIVNSDRAYCEWMLRLEDLDEDLRYSLEYYLQG